MARLRCRQKFFQKPGCFQRRTMLFEWQVGFSVVVFGVMSFDFKFWDSRSLLGCSEDLLSGPIIGA